MTKGEQSQFPVVGPGETLVVYLYGSLIQNGLFSAEPDKRGLAIPAVLWGVLSLEEHKHFVLFVGVSLVSAPCRPKGL